MPNFTSFGAEMAEKTSSNGQNSVDFLGTSKFSKSHPKLVFKASFMINQSKKIKFTLKLKFLVKLTCLTSSANVSAVS